MDEAQIQILKSKLNFIIQKINDEILITKSQISSCDDVINQSTNRLKELTQINVNLEEKLKQLKSDISTLESKKAGLNSEKDSLQQQIDENNAEIDRLKKKIADQTSPGAVIGDIFNHIFNPIGAAVSDIIRECTDGINRCLQQIKTNQDEIDYRKGQMNEVEQKIAELQIQIGDLNGSISQVSNDQADCDRLLKKTGIQKTLWENKKLVLESFKNQAEMVLSQCEDNKDLLDIGIDIVGDMEKNFDELNEAFDRNQKSIEESMDNYDKNSNINGFLAPFGAISFIPRARMG